MKTITDILISEINKAKMTGKKVEFFFLGKDEIDKLKYIFSGIYNQPNMTCTVNKKGIWFANIQVKEVKEKTFIYSALC